MDNVITLKEILLNTINTYLQKEKKCALDKNFAIQPPKEKDIGMRRAVAYAKAINLVNSDRELLLITAAILLGQGTNLKQRIANAIFDTYGEQFDINPTYRDMFGVTPKSVLDEVLKLEMIKMNKDNKDNIYQIEELISKIKPTNTFFKRHYENNEVAIVGKIIKFIEANTEPSNQPTP